MVTSGREHPGREARPRGLRESSFEPGRGEHFGDGGAPAQATGGGEAHKRTVSTWVHLVKVFRIPLVAPYLKVFSLKLYLLSR